MIRDLKHIVKRADLAFTRFYLNVFGESDSLVIFLFHSLFRDKKEIDMNIADPMGGITIAGFRQFIEYFLGHDYRFISPYDILKGPVSDNKYALITFDDGYFNNRYAVPILKEFGVPAVFSISANNVKYGRPFWWDVLYRERKKQGKTTECIYDEGRTIKLKKSREIEEYIRDRIGIKAIKAECDIDRVFTPSELKEFSEQEYVFLGNHTSDHANLVIYDSDEIRSQMLDAQSVISDITGKTPTVISYPYGNYSDEVIKIANESGFRIGITTVHKKNRLPIGMGDSRHLRLSRFALSEDSGLTDQCEMIRSDVSVYYNIKSLSKRGY
ncbi:polysaccharide deacetylase family protein [Candidatus Omnitrophota bacterium]